MLISTNFHYNHYQDSSVFDVNLSVNKVNHISKFAQ